MAWTRAWDAAHPVEQVEHLSAACHLPRDGIPDDVVPVFQHIGLNGIAFQRRILDGADFPDAGQRHVERARNRGGGQGQQVHVRISLLDGLLVFHAETLFLVDDQQAEILELHGFGEHHVGADEHIRPSAAQIPHHLPMFGVCLETAEHFHLHREAGEPFAEILVMLGSQYGGRNQESDLLSVHDGLEHRA